MVDKKIEEQGARKAIIGLNLLRGIAALLVFLGHARAGSFVEFGALPPEQQSFLTKILFGITRTSYEAVIVFFVLSGYLVGGQVISRVRNGRFRIETYALDRATRIFLPLIPACLLTVAVSWFFFDQRPNWLQAVLNMLGLNGVLTETLSRDIPLWTLPYEIWFYVLAGALGYLISKRQGSLVAFLITACGVGIFCVLAARFALFWCLGAVTILLSEQKQLRYIGMAGCVILAFGVVDHQLASESKSFVSVTYLPMPAADALIAIGISLIILFLSDPMTDWSLRALRKPALYLSSISYTLYLFHHPVLAALDTVFPRADNLSLTAVEMFGAKVAITLVVINGFYLAFEGNTTKLRHYLKQRLFNDEGALKQHLSDDEGIV